MDPSKPSWLRRVLAIAILVRAAVVAIRPVVGLVVGLVSAVLWILLAATLVVAALWARSTLKSGRRRRAVKRASSQRVTAAPSEDPVAVEMRRSTEQLRVQGGR